jgi:protein gp37
MANKSTIEWTESTWDPVTGCTKVSAGCKNCYAEHMALRLQSMGQPNYANGFRLTCHEHVLELPLRWRKPQMVFVNSMSDLFHRDVATAFIQRVFGVMNRARWHCFQILTKRSTRLAKLSAKLDWAANVWMGVTVEDADCVHRIRDLK